MADPMIRSLIRELLGEELARLRNEGLLGPGSGGASPRVREEIVFIRNDTELAEFVRRLSEMLKDGRSGEEIRQGRRTFRLASSGSNPAEAATRRQGAPAPAAIARFERGVVSERQIEALPPGTTRLMVGKAVRFTPLARDRLRQCGIAIERTG
jgi:hypothetical protein